MITENQLLHNTWQDIEESLKIKMYNNEKLKKELSNKLKNTTIEERKFIIFKLFFHGINNYDKNTITYLLKYNPFFVNKLLKIIEESKESKQCSEIASYNRRNCIDTMNFYNTLLNKTSILARELTLSNSLELTILFSYLLWNGYFSKNKVHEYHENENDIIGLLFVEIINGEGVCRNYSEMLKDFLNNNGYNSVILVNHFDDKTSVNYSISIDRKNSYEILEAPEKTWFEKKKANHTFNLIEDRGLYIYDPTNLLIYKFKNRKTANLINGIGKNTIYPYRSYNFCYSKEDEKLLDRLFIEDNFLSPYDKKDFIWTNEFVIESINNNKSLLEDFYTEVRQDIVGISEETKKILVKKKITK